MTNLCMDKCPNNKSFNAYSNNETERCIDYYDLLDQVVSRNANLKQLKKENLGGSLTDPLECMNTTNITTPYSHRMISTE